MSGMMLHGLGDCTPELNCGCMVPTILHESPCGEVFTSQEDATSHAYHCGACAGVLERIESELSAAALPKDAPGAWIRQALDNNAIGR